MTTTFNIENLPSKARYKNLEDRIKYENMEEYINNDQKEEAYAWINTFQTYMNQHLYEYLSDNSAYDTSKRCRDLVHILNIIKKNINELVDSASYEVINSNIDNFINILMFNRYDNCSIISPSEYSNMDSVKEIDDICEDITYAKYNSCEINNSIYCEKIKKHLEKQNSKINAVYSTSNEELIKIIKYYDFTSYENFEKIFQLITCSPCTNTESSYSPKNISISAGISLFGLTFIGLFFYRNSPLGTWFSSKILKGKTMGNNLIHEITEKVSDNTSESLYMDPPNIGYQVSYGTTEDF
ncbi:PIR Superfamily Protein [Plasmodium ovale wallikeri]|uniref:PIR Superfamily Protein n=1 Tax=Plasmodium ovale wallikeri TaxID=864142 RepID=A0A1A9AIT3_PLAOA|nr:PIR Superfamily Protein [Plasmodium ovale wallikeri]SBT56522.1 PIR Superfamily Protein [Plasmodium ovale wallikeri]